MSLAVCTRTNAPAFLELQPTSKAHLDGARWLQTQRAGLIAQPGSPIAAFLPAAGRKL